MHLDKYWQALLNKNCLLLKMLQNYHIQSQYLFIKLLKQTSKCLQICLSSPLGCFLIYWLIGQISFFLMFSPFLFIVCTVFSSGSCYNLDILSRWNYHPKNWPHTNPEAQLLFSSPSPKESWQVQSAIYSVKQPLVMF